MNATKKKQGFEKESIKRIEELFNTKFEKTDNSYSVKIKSFKSKTVICIDILVEEGKDCLISVYTNNCHLQLQSCSSFLISEMLEEVIFISETKEKISIRKAT